MKRVQVSDEDAEILQAAKELQHRYLDIKDELHDVSFLRQAAIQVAYKRFSPAFLAEQLGLTNSQLYSILHYKFSGRGPGHPRKEEEDDGWGSYFKK